MEKTSCHEKVCKRCGWCCTNLGMAVDISDEEEEKVKKVVFEKSGVIYLRTISKFFLSFSPETAKKLKEHARKSGIRVDIKPNKIIYDKNKDKAVIYDYYLNHTKCPFYKDKSCLVYKDRPAACRKFPNIDSSYAKEVAVFVKKNKIDFSGITYEEAVKKCSIKI